MLAKGMSFSRRLENPLKNCPSAAAVLFSAVRVLFQTNTRGSQKAEEVQITGFS
jgi:hypothetical protein